MPEVAYNVDLLFPTKDNEQPGTMHVKVMSPRAKTRLTIVIEVDQHAPIMENITSIISYMQKDIFNRINTDAKSETTIFLDAKSHQDEFPDCEYVRLIYDGSEYGYEKVEEIVY